ncbi:head GIN domain-containing protein [Winogradskyella schleiferi]|uniref:head GIN domain-containing protein n=1 Tax=Winogradskyella schleiferi TaxID=2686078 RepID=UPI0015BC837A|nr:head GIN domain-containing protein [Winogradskyella schleiferi]
MTTLTRIIVTSIISLLLLSCNLIEGVDGNGHVINVERDISSDFNEIKVSQGLDLYITQSDNVSLSIEADENLQDIIMTEVENSVLRIYATENIRRANSKKIMLNVETISAIKATSGSDVYSKNTIKVTDLELNSTSGADVKLDVKTKSLNCHATSGSDIKLSGSTNALIAEATSGSDINASELEAETSNVRATSGADISVNTSKSLIAKATSGGDIRYSGNPENLEKSDTSAGSVRKQ